jgi:sulfoxide reductase heme-binding subunit YedZ
MTGRGGRIALKAAVWVACLLPLAALGWRLATDELLTNPIDHATDTLGNWTLRLLLASLTVTPLRLVTGWSWPVTLRRLLGLFAFAYAVLHFTIWIAVDHFFDWPTMWADVVKRPYITVGVSALVLLLPLAATSTAGMVKRLVYAIAILGVLHFLWLAKVGVVTPYYYVAWLAVLLGVRAVVAVHRRVRARRRGPARSYQPIDRARIQPTAE